MLDAALVGVTSATTRKRGVERPGDQPGFLFEESFA